MIGSSPRRTALSRISAAALSGASLSAQPTHAHAQSLLTRVLGLQESGRLTRAYAKLGESFYPSSLAWSPDSRYLAATGLSTRTIDIWDVHAREKVHSVDIGLPPGPGYGRLTWSPDGRSLVSTGGQLLIWDTRTWQIAARVTGMRANSPRFSLDGRHLAFCHVGGDMFLYDTATWQLVRQRLVPKPPPNQVYRYGLLVYEIAFWPGRNIVGMAADGFFPVDGKSENQSRVIFWDYDKDVDFLDADFIDAYHPFTPINGLAFSPSGDRVATRAKDGPIQVFDLTHPPYDRVFAGDVTNDNHLGLDFSADGRFLAYAIGRERYASEVRLLDARTFQPVDAVRLPGYAPFLSFSPDASRLAVGSADAVWVWDLPAA